MLALGSGALRFLHELSHSAAEHVHTGSTDHDADPDPHPSHPPVHDPADCFTHAQLNLPMMQSGYVPLLVCLGLFVAFLTSMPAPVMSRRPVLLLDCRGPPVSSLQPVH